MAFKYLIVRDDEMGQVEAPIVFDSYLSAQVMGRAFNVVAGGFVELRGKKSDCGDRQDIDVHCYSDPRSCDFKSRGRVDALIITGSRCRPIVQF